MYRDVGILDQQKA